VNVLMITNLRSGFGDPGLNEFIRELGSHHVDVTLRFLNEGVDLGHLLRDVKEYTRVVAAGGDGTVSAIAYALRDTGIPLLAYPADQYMAKKGRVRVRTGVNTSEVSLYAGSTLVATRLATSYSELDLGLVAVPADGVSLRVVATNPDGKITETSAKYRRLAYPAATSIVIDKSDFRLYLVNDDVLVKSYPIAIGRLGMETPTRLWKINAKYYTDPNGIYGPRKMRLYAQTGSSWVYTAYNIHGTNEPWVIGTKASHGCIRLRNEDILDLFARVQLGTLVLTRE